MLNFKTFDDKAIVEEKKFINMDDFKKANIFNNEIIWTYLIGNIAKNNNNIYRMITNFDIEKDHSIYFEGQPQTPYLRIEGNSYIDMALGALKIRDNTTSGLNYSKECGNEVCFVEAKYLSDLSTKTEHSPIRNQMDRVIENLINLVDDSNFPDKVVFTLLTPRIFRTEFGTRIYSYKFNEYRDSLLDNCDSIVDKVELSKNNELKRFEYSKQLGFIEKQLKRLELNWVTFEDIFEKVCPDLKDIDITKINDAYKAWNVISNY